MVRSGQMLKGVTGESVKMDRHELKSLRQRPSKDKKEFLDRLSNETDCKGGVKEYSLKMGPSERDLIVIGELIFEDVLPVNFRETEEVRVYKLTDDRILIYRNITKGKKGYSIISYNCMDYAENKDREVLKLAGLYSERTIS